MSHNQFHSEDFPMLVETGFIAVKQGNQQAAEKIFRAAQLLKPEHSAPVLGFGYIALNAMRLETARHLFSSVLKKEPENALAKVLLGFSYLVDKFTSIKKDAKTIEKGPTLKPQEISALAETGEKLVKEALKESSDPGVHSLGKSALALLEKVTEYEASPLKT
ncbi:MAG: hypothetical protein P4L16_06500 [Chlamydiales bacterium]|nr:hypothetical protein [Chlamydiales bacterium]